MLDSLFYQLIRTLFHALGKLPPGVRNSAARCLGYLLYRIDGHHRRIALDNLRLAYGAEMSTKQAHALTREVFDNLFNILFEIGWAMHLTEKDFPRYFSIKGLHHYRSALRQGKGVLLLGAHFGNWELLPIVAHMVGMPVRIVYRALDLPFADRFIAETRSRFGGVLISTRTGAMQKIYRSLRKGFPVGLLIDQNEGWRQGVYAPFFGRMACTNPGMAKLALKTGAPVVPLFLIRQGQRFNAQFGTPILPIHTGDATRDVEENLAIYNQTIESYIRRYPQQWFWIHQRWKTPVMWKWPDPERRKKWYAGQKRRAKK